MTTTTHDRIMAPQSWVVLPPGKKAFCRFATDEIPSGCELAISAELRDANQGFRFPWGNLPTPEKASRLWREHRIGIGGLYHNRWFKTSDGRLGGAPNVPLSLPGSLRSCLLLDGGGDDVMCAENEGFAIVKPVSQETGHMYRKVQLHAAEHVGGDGGAIIVSPIFDGRVVYVGFVGYCQLCPNPELISVRQLRASVPDYDFVLMDEWKNWRV